MNQERWQRLKEIVAGALEQESPLDRTALLTRECAQDASLLEQAESFLSDADTLSRGGHDSLEECAAFATAAVRRSGGVSMTGRRIGAYIIVRELGHGGMATVFLAARADGYFEKQVAIKILKPGGGSSAELLGRFRAEREVLASLEHPNIAALFDAGTTEEGMPHFIMEYVPGIPLTAYIREHLLPLRERLALFRKTCAAVEVAHRKRIVHRDLKRSNILVNDQGEPKLLDFGIAKLLEENPLALTTTGQQRLTPISASPEQLRGEEVTTASDIYALGALLYEILTGHTPHVFPTRHPGLNEVTRVVCEEDPALPSSVANETEMQRALRGDLDAIILRAMQKDPSSRYASVGDLTEDVRRYLDGEPVAARPAGLTYRLTRSLTRHQASLARIALVAAVILIAVGAGALLLQRQSRSSAGKAGNGEGLAIPEKSIAVLPFDNFAANEPSSYFADGVQDDILTDLATVRDLKVISRTGVAPYRKGPRNIREIGRALGVAYVLQGSVRKLNDRVRVNAQLIDTRTDTQTWAEQYDRRMDDLFALQSDLAQAIVAQLKGRLSPSEKAVIESRPTTNVKAYDLYLQARESFLQYQHSTAIESLNRAIVLDPNFALAYCLLANANLYIYRFGDDPSEARLTAAKDAADAALRIAPDLPESHLAQAQYYYLGQRDYERTEAELAAAPPSPAGRAKFFDLAALAERRLGHWKEALRDGGKALQLDPHDPFIATEVIQSYICLRRYSEAEELADRAIKLIPTPEAPFWQLKTDSILDQGDLKQARTFLETAPSNLRDKHGEMARIAFYARDFPRATSEVEAARRSGTMQRAEDLDLFDGSIARAQGDREKAKMLFEKARTALEAALQKRPDDPMTLGSLAWAYAGLGRKEDALRVSQ
ncbi:MAG: protein kinase domain-containing protein [Chthoniobacterales bacterium]